MQQGGRDRGIVELKVGEDRRDFERMREIRIAGGTLLLAVDLHGIHVCAIEQVLVDMGIVLAHPLDKVVLAHHPLCGGGLCHRVANDLAAFPGRAYACLVLHSRQLVGRTRHSDFAFAALQRKRVQMQSYRISIAHHQ